jgi:hypothetical protein
MNLWIEGLIAAGRTQDAIAASELNLEFFPTSVSLLGSLGRLYEPTDKAKAIAYYERALQTRPEPPGLRRRVDSLKATTTTPPGTSRPTLP